MSKFNLLDRESYDRENIGHVILAGFIIILITPFVVLLLPFFAIGLWILEE